MDAEELQEVMALGGGGGAGHRALEGGEVGEGAVDETERLPARLAQAAGQLLSQFGNFRRIPCYLVDRHRLVW